MQHSFDSLCSALMTSIQGQKHTPNKMIADYQRPAQVQFLKSAA
jgi:hypothetical protein